MTPSLRQQAVYDTWTTTDNNLLLEAVAGSGKTSTLMGILERSKYRTLFLAFNKSIQEEISHRIEKAGYIHAKAMTIHSLGLKSLQNHFGYKGIVINKGKNFELMKALEKYNKKVFSKLSWEERSKVNITLMEMNDVSRMYLTNEPKEIFEHMVSMDKYYFEDPIVETLWQDFLFVRTDMDAQKNKVIDFLDMIYLPVLWKIMIPIQPYYLCVDEAQDLTLLQHQFVENLINQGDIHKWVAVGDSRQAIYGFSGSHSSSFKLFEQKPNVVKLPLDVCYRCSSSIITQANAVYNVMMGHKKTPGIVKDIDNVKLIKDGSMIICRNTAPLLELFFILFAMEKKVVLKGEDVSGTVMKLLKPYSFKTIRQVERLLDKQLSEISFKENKTQEEMFKMYRLRDNYKIFSVLTKHYPNDQDSVQKLIEMFTEMTKEGAITEDTITLCTIHKSKGLEADIVYILNENLIPSKFAKSPSQLEQEENLRYVARTRAKEEMYYLNLKL